MSLLQRLRFDGFSSSSVLKYDDALFVELTMCRFRGWSLLCYCVVVFVAVMGIVLGRLRCNGHCFVQVYVSAVPISFVCVICFGVVMICLQCVLPYDGLRLFSVVSIQPSVYWFNLRSLSSYRVYQNTPPIVSLEQQLATKQLVA